MSISVQISLKEDGGPVLSNMSYFRKKRISIKKAQAQLKREKCLVCHNYAYKPVYSHIVTKNGKINHYLRFRHIDKRRKTGLRSCYLPIGKEDL